MQAVVFKDTLKVAVEHRPIPQLCDSKDVIVKVRYTALCGRLVSTSSKSQAQDLLTSMNLASYTSSVVINRLQKTSSWAMNSRVRSGRLALT